jgi:hypothetical protein
MGIDNEKIEFSLLKEFKPILIIYFPDYYTANANSFLRIEALKNKLGESFKDKYLLLAIPYQGDSFKLDLLSVVKSKFIKDKDLKKYVNALQEEIIVKEHKTSENSKNLNDVLEGLNKLLK